MRGRRRRRCRTNCTPAVSHVAATAATMPVSRILAEADDERCAAEYEDEQRAHDVGRPECEVDPALRAPDPVLKVGDRIGRQAQQCEHQRHRVVGFGQARPAFEDGDAEDGRQHAEPAGDERPGPQEPAEMLGPARAPDTPAGSGSPTSRSRPHRRAEYRDPDPGEGEDPVLERAHPARQQHLRQECDDRPR